MTEIGEWLHSLRGARRNHPKTVRDIATTERIWERAELPREALIARIRATGGITCEHALDATTLLDGRIDLANGVHRWAVTTELEIKRVPVRMTYESAEDAWSWERFWG